jgi:hypothetical protein
VHALAIYTYVPEPANVPGIHSVAIALGATPPVVNSRVNAPAAAFYKAGRTGIIALAI